MAAQRTPPTEQARRIFDSLGYTIHGDGAAFRADRKWRSVAVTALAEPAADPHDDPEAHPRRSEAAGLGDLRCVVTWRENADEQRRKLAEADPAFEWAVIAVDEEGEEYDVHRPDRGS